MRAQQTLDVARAMNVVFSVTDGDYRPLGEVMIEAGANPERVSRMVIQQTMKAKVDKARASGSAR